MLWSGRGGKWSVNREEKIKCGRRKEKDVFGEERNEEGCEGTKEGRELKAIKEEKQRKEGRRVWQAKQREN